MKRTLFIAALLSAAVTLRAEDKVDFAKTIQPILEKSCIECHGPDKDKGDLRLHTKETAFSVEHVIVPSKADESELIKRVSLPADHDDIMPPKGDPLTKEEIAALKAWINEGATWPEGLTLGGGEAKATASPAKKSKPAGSEFANLKKTENVAAEKEAIEKLAELGISVRPIAQNLEWKEATVRPQDTNKTSEAIALLKNIPSLVDLNLAGLKLSDKDLEAIAPLSNLLRLHLENTPITDEGVAKLKGLVNLHYLNLYNTAVSDAALENLTGMEHLSNLYLWQTKVTDEGAAKLQKAIPDVTINRGEELKMLAKADEKKAEEKKEEKKEEKAEPKKEEPKAEEKKAEEPKKEEPKEEKKA